MKQRAIFPALQLSEGALNEQVYKAIHNAILTGQLPAGTKIPSSRHLSEMMMVSRNTIIQGIDRLIDEGYLETRQGSGTYVTQNIPDHLLLEIQKKPPKLDQISPPKLNRTIATLQPRWQQYQKKAKPTSIFKVGVGCTDLFQDRKRVV